jgi:hypothetical protein
VVVEHQEVNSINVLINARVQAEPQALEILVDEILAHAEIAYRCTIVREKWSGI